MTADQLPSLEGKDEHKLEYIKAMMSIAMDDIRHVALYISLAFAVVIVFITQIGVDAVVGLSAWARTLVSFGLLFLLASALFFFRYIRQLHIARMKMARCLPSLNVNLVREYWAGDRLGVWTNYKSEYMRGLTFLALGIVSVSVV
ncbi:MAG: hypothetical protein ACRDKF_08985, partial [Actinomycetota bacterium]